MSQPIGTTVDNNPERTPKHLTGGSDNPRMLTITAAAADLGIAPITIRRWIAAGKLRAYRYGPRTIRIERKDLDKMRKQVAAATYDYLADRDTDSVVA